MSDRRSIFDFADLLRANPWQPVKVLAERYGTHHSNVQRMLARLEIQKRRGNDPVNGRRNVLLFAIRLPKEKQNAITKGN